MINQQYAAQCLPWMEIFETIAEKLVYATAMLNLALTTDT